MIEEPGIVTEVTGKRASVARRETAHCGACSTGKQCGTSILSDFFFRRQPRLIDVWDPVGVRPGDRVVIGINEKTLQRASWIIFVMPLLGLLGGGLLGEWSIGDSSAGELATIIGGLTGLIAGIGAAGKVGGSLLGDPRRHIIVLRVTARASHRL